MKKAKTDGSVRRSLTGRRSAGRLPLWALRASFGLVFCLNAMCALQFAFAPYDFAAAYELSGVSGAVAVQGLGVAFLMWNATYPAFIASPQRFSILGPVILAQQAIGLVGECCILAVLPAGHAQLAASIMRFIAFDGVGLVLMTVSFAWWFKSSAGRSSAGAHRA